MCEVNDKGGAGVAPAADIQEDDALEKIFSECDVPSTGRVTVARLIGYMRNHMSTHGSPEILKDLRRSMLAAASYGDEVTREQYYNVSRRWLAKIRGFQHYQKNHQDGNNNINVHQNSDSFADDLPELPASGRLTGSTSRVRTTLVLAKSTERTIDDADASAHDSGSESHARTLQGFLDLSTSTVVDTAGRVRCEIPDPLFGDLSFVDGTYNMPIDHPVAETAQDLRQRAHRCAVDNDHLREELQRAEDSIAILEKQLAVAGRKLELANSRFERLQGEHEEHRELLAVAERDREVLGARNRRLEKDNSLLRREIAASDTEMRRLNADLDRANEQKEERIKLLAQCRRELIEQQALYDEARAQILQMELTNDQLREKYDISTRTAEHLKIVVRELETRISELQTNQSYFLQGEGLFASPRSVNGLDSDTEMFQESDKMIPCSLRDEMKASGYCDLEANCQGFVIRNFNDVTDGSDVNSNEYVLAVDWATEQLERAAADFEVSHKELQGIELPPIRSPEGTARLFQTGTQVSATAELCSNTENLQRFKTQIRHAITILSAMALRKVTNADTKDATTQLDLLDIIAELPAVCNSDAVSITYANNHNSNNNNNSYNKFCSPYLTYRKENHPCEEDEEALLVDAGPGGACVSAPSPLASPLDRSPPISKVTSTPRSSPPHGSSPLPAGYSREREIIVPIVAALDEIIQRTSDSGNVYNPISTGIRSEHNPRYNYTLPSGFGGDVSHRAESPPSTTPTDADNAVTLQSPCTTTIDGFGGDVRRSYAWRCQESTNTDDTSDDTCGTDSNGSQSRSSGEPDRRSFTLDLLVGSSSSKSAEYPPGVSERTGMRIVDPGTYPDEPTSPVPVRVQITSDNRTSDGDDPDAVEGLNHDLEKLTLRSLVSRNKHRVTDTSSQGQVTITNAGDRPVGRMLRSVGQPPHGRVPKRKSSVHQRLSDYYSGCEAGQWTEPREPHGSTIVEQSAVSGETRAPRASSSRRRRSNSYPGRHSEPRNVDSDTLELSWHGVKRDEEDGLTHPQITYDTELTEPGGYPSEESNRPNTMPGIDLRRRRTRGVLDTPTWPLLAKPTEPGVSLGNRRTRYLISDTEGSPLLTLNLNSTPTPRLPSNDEVLGNGREIAARPRSVAHEMSSEEDSSDSECIPDLIDREENVQVVALSLPPPTPPPQTQTRSPPLSASPAPTQRQQASLQFSTIGIGSTVTFGDPLPYRRYRVNTGERIAGATDGSCQRQFKTIRRLHRSLSESDSEPCRSCAECGSRCSCGWHGVRSTILCVQEESADTAEDPERRQTLGVFSNSPDGRLIELGLAGPPDGFDLCDRLNEDELEQKYTALSIGLGTDRITLPRRLALSIRQRDHAEHNLATEVERMQGDIQALTPLCVDRESVERVERARHQLEIISRCALRVSCTAELLGATHQERRVSKAALLADKYLQALRARCDKLSAQLAETKDAKFKFEYQRYRRILAENNIVMEENSSEFIEDLVPRMRYRGVPSTNRATMSKRRASIATISQPTTVNTLQEVTKDNARLQRIPLTVRMSLRRPSLGYDIQKWENERLDRTESKSTLFKKVPNCSSSSSSSIGELRDIFEQAESRRGSWEENNNLICSQSSNFSGGNCESGDSEVWASIKEDMASFQLQTTTEDLSTENRLSGRRAPLTFRTIQEHVLRLPIPWYILFLAIFFFGFYSNRYVSTRNAVPLKWWSIDEIIKRYIHIQRNAPPPF